MINTWQGQLKGCSCMKIASVKTKILSAAERFSVGRFVKDVFFGNKDLYRYGLKMYPYLFIIRRISVIIFLVILYKERV